MSEWAPGEEALITLALAELEECGEVAFTLQNVHLAEEVAFRSLVSEMDPQAVTGLDIREARLQARQMALDLTLDLQLGAIGGLN